MPHRTWKELSKHLNDLRTVNRNPSNDQHAKDLQALITEILNHPLSGFAVDNDAEYDHGIGEREVSARAEFNLLVGYEQALDQLRKFAGVYSSLHKFINLEMRAASAHQNHIEKMKEAGLWDED